MRYIAIAPLRTFAPHMLHSQTVAIVVAMFTCAQDEEEGAFRRLRTHLGAKLIFIGVSEDEWDAIMEGVR